MKNQGGFSLIELMIVLVIMATLSVLSTKSIQEAIRNKVKMQTKIDDMSEIRDALRLMEKDVNLAFHYNDIETEMFELIKKKRIELSKGSPTSTLPGGITTTSTTTTTLQGVPPAQVYNPNDPNDPLNKKAIDRINPTTHFIGKENAMYFSTLNSTRTSEEQIQADFIKVGYEIQNCKRPGQDSSQSSCLVRKTARVVEGDPSTLDDGYIFLSNIEDFKIRYKAQGQTDWTNSWDSSIQGSDSFGKFPDAVEITVKVEKGDSGKTRKITMQIVAAVRFSNNIKKAADPNNPNGT